MDEIPAKLIKKYPEHNDYLLGLDDRFKNAFSSNIKM